MPVVMISGHGNIETAVSTIQIGAYDFIEKPFEADKLLVLTKRAMEFSSLRKENKELRIKNNVENVELIGNSNSIVITSYSIHYTKLYEELWRPVRGIYLPHPFTPN